MAEHSSVMQLLTERVIDDVVAQVAAWAAEGSTCGPSINISSRDLYSDDIVDALADRAAPAPRRARARSRSRSPRARCWPTRAGPPARSPAIVRARRRVALDDFGTGYSSLQHLRKLPISRDQDRPVVRGRHGRQPRRRRDRPVHRGAGAGSLGIRTVAEGVETEYTRAAAGRRRLHAGPGLADRPPDAGRRAERLDRGVPGRLGQCPRPRLRTPRCPTACRAAVRTTTATRRTRAHSVETRHRTQSAKESLHLSIPMDWIPLPSPPDRPATPPS